MGSRALSERTTVAARDRVSLGHQLFLKQLTCTVSASKMVMLRSLPPSANNFPSGDTSKLVTGFLATVLVLSSFHVFISQTEMKAFLSPLFRLLADPAPPDGSALTTVKSLCELEPRPKRAERNVHFKLLLSVGCCMTCNGSGAGSEAELFSGTAQTLILCSEAPRNCKTPS